MTDEDDRTRIVLKVVLQPHDGLDVEVVGRFIQEQDRGLLQEQLGQGDTHLPAAGELIRETVQILVSEAQPHEHTLDSGFHLGHVMVVQTHLEITEHLQCLIILRRSGRVSAQSLASLIKQLLRLHGICEGGLGFGHQRAAFHLHAFLWEVAHLDTLRFVDLALVLLDDSGDDLHQGALPGTVGTGQRNTFPGPDGEVQAAEEIAGAVGDAEVFECKHGKEGRHTCAGNGRRASGETVLKTQITKYKSQQ